MRLALSARGSSTGIARITGLPFVPKAVVSAIPSVILGEFSGLFGLVAGSAYALEGTPGSPVLTVVSLNLNGSASTPLSCTEGNLSNASVIDVAFSYTV